MNLKEWSERQPTRASRHPRYFNSFWIADTGLVDRAKAWVLEDYRVSSVSGGTIWFTPREVVEEQTK